MMGWTRRRRGRGRESPVLLFSCLPTCQLTILSVGVCGVCVLCCVIFLRVWSFVVFCPVRASVSFRHHQRFCFFRPQKNHPHPQPSLSAGKKRQRNGCSFSLFGLLDGGGVPVKVGHLALWEREEARRGRKGEQNKKQDGGRGWESGGRRSGRRRAPPLGRPAARPGAASLPFGLRQHPLSSLSLSLSLPLSPWPPA